MAVHPYEETVRSGQVIVTDGGVETRLLFGAFGPEVTLHPVLGVAPLVGDGPAGVALRSVYAGYIEAVRPTGLPVVIGTPTFRAGLRWVRDAGLSAGEVGPLNARAVAAHRRLQAEAAYDQVFVAGVIGPAGDAYTPADGLPSDQAVAAHRPQVAALAEAGVDFLYAPTFPAVAEATGAAQAMAETGLPYVVSFVLGPDGRVLDGTPLAAAMADLDAAVSPTPLCYSISCVHPTVAATALSSLPPAPAGASPAGAHRRLLECKANGSSMPTAELLTLDHPVSDAPDVFAAEMWSLHERFGLQVLGGCCGTDDRHIAALAALSAGHR